MSKSRSSDPFTTPFDLNLHFFVRTPPKQPPTTERRIDRHGASSYERQRPALDKPHDDDDASIQCTSVSAVAMASSHALSS